MYKKIPYYLWLSIFRFLVLALPALILDYASDDNGWIDSSRYVLIFNAFYVIISIPLRKDGRYFELSDLVWIATLVIIAFSVVVWGR